MKHILFVTGLAGTLVSGYLAPVTAFAGNISVRHKGEIKYFEYSVEYLGPLGVTTAGADGITYSPFAGGASHEDTLLPDKYFGDYPLYFSGGELNYIIHLKNTGPRTFKNLKITASQEFLNPSGGEGEAFAGTDAQEWFIRELASGEEISLAGQIIIPADGRSGIDQTHLQIFHSENSENWDAENEGAGRLILDDPQAGLWCPAG
ncbi:MAG: hypothetical protein Q7S36_02765 [Candidatus Liptonbacteria bacterium]|nr:hypothetical protein [Candidatus Liptonbacteria bacterium]